MPYEKSTDHSLKNKSIAKQLHHQRPLSLNPDDYRQDLASFQLTEEQENELLDILWNIMKTMVGIGWGVDTVHYLLPEIFGNASTETSPSDSTKIQERKIDDE